MADSLNFASGKPVENETYNHWNMCICVSDRLITIMMTRSDQPLWSWPGGLSFLLPACWVKLPLGEPLPHRPPCGWCHTGATTISIIYIVSHTSVEKCSIATCVRSCKYFTSSWVADISIPVYIIRQLRCSSPSHRWPMYNVYQYINTSIYKYLYQAIAVFISQPKIAKHLTKLELLAALTAAVVYSILIVLMIMIA